MSAVLSGFFMEVTMKDNDFTSGAILPKLLKFMLPVLFAMFLQMYIYTMILKKN